MPARRRAALVAQVAQHRPGARGEHRLGLEHAAALEHVGGHVLRVGHDHLLEQRVLAQR